jgi:nucleotide-binding universal stress UspA family protein
MSTTSAPVIAALGHRGWTAVVDQAVDETVRRDCVLHLVHAGPAVGEAGSQLLVAATRYAGVRLGDRVTATLAPAEAVPALVELGRDAALVVVGQPGGHAYPHARSAAVGVASRLAAPVLSVPEGWLTGGRRPTVVAGVDEPARAGGVLAAAFAAARDRHARLVVLTASWRPRGAGPAPLTQVTDPGSAERSESALWAALGRYDVDALDLPVDVVVADQRPGELLLQAARYADLLVLGRHTALVPTGSHLGPVGRAVLREAACPVLLAAPESHHGVEPTVGHGHLVSEVPAG